MMFPFPDIKLQARTSYRFRPALLTVRGLFRDSYYVSVNMGLFARYKTRAVFRRDFD